MIQPRLNHSCFLMRVKRHEYSCALKAEQKAKKHANGDVNPNAEKKFNKTFCSVFRAPLNNSAKERNGALHFFTFFDVSITHFDT